MTETGQPVKASHYITLILCVTQVAMAVPQSGLFSFGLHGGHWLKSSWGFVTCHDSAPHQTITDNTQCIYNTGRLEIPQSANTSSNWGYQSFMMILYPLEENNQSVPSYCIPVTGRITQTHQRSHRLWQNNFQSVKSGKGFTNICNLHNVQSLPLPNGLTCH